MRGQNDGIKNEEIIANYINERRYDRLSSYWKGFVKEIDPKIKKDTELNCEKVGGKGYKPDIIVETPEEECAISVKKGTSNSVHQEKTSQFVDYCKIHLGMTDEEADSLLLFLYGDGTTDGSAPREERLGIDEVKERYSEQIEIVQNFLDNHKEELLKRFLIYGKEGIRAKRKADYIFHGTVEGGISCPLNSFMIEELSRIKGGENSLTIGPLSLQVWNRNPSEEQEDRRHSIQIKWASCEKDLRMLRARCLEYSSRLEKRIKGDNSHGFDNQELIVNYYSNGKVKDYYDVARQLIYDINPNARLDDKVEAVSINKKARARISVATVGKNLSISSGSGNSVHQEKISDFIDFCMSLGMNEEEKRAMLFVHYADGTLDGTGKLEDRLNGKAAIIEKYKDERDIAQKFLDKHKREMLERFLVYGKNTVKDQAVDYIYYGSYNDGVFAPVEKAIEYLLEVENCKNAVLSVGPLSVQRWNSNLSGDPSKEYKRNSIQVKWGKLRAHVYNIYEQYLISKRVKQNGTREGTDEEYNLVRTLNKQHDISDGMWKKLTDILNLESIDDIYAVRVTRHVKSKLSNRFVNAKSDVYLAKINISSDFLVDNNYTIDEDMFDEALKNKTVEIIPSSGISCKIKESKSFTYEKLTIASFVSLFKNKMIGAGMSLFVKSEEEMLLNNDVIKAWGIAFEEFKAYWEKLLDTEIEEREYLRKETAMVIKKKSEEVIKSLVDNDDRLKSIIFRGDYIFDEPYNASFIYSHGELKQNNIDSYSVTTGSGRHKGKYTIIFKP